MLTARIHLKAVYRRFFQFWLIFPNRNYKSRTIGFNFNWCWQHALHLKKKALPIFENLVTTSRTTTKVISCLKIPLTSMCVVVRTSSPGSRLRQFFPTSPPPELVFQSIEEILLQPVLKSFITVFIQYNEGLENKLTRAPLLGLAKSIYYKAMQKSSDPTTELSAMTSCLTMKEWNELKLVPGENGLALGYDFVFFFCFFFNR